MKKYTLNWMLSLVLGGVLLAMVLLRAFVPRLILPEAGLPELVLICLASLLLEHYCASKEKRNWLMTLLFGAVTFGLLPFAACFVTGKEALLLTLVGTATLGVTAWVFDSATQRLSTGPVAKAAPVVTALGLYLASQCLMGLI